MLPESVEGVTIEECTVSRNKQAGVVLSQIHCIIQDSELEENPQGPLLVSVGSEKFIDWKDQPQEKKSCRQCQIY